jgi:hypothetical protein
MLFIAPTVRPARTKRRTGLIVSLGKLQTPGDIIGLVARQPTMMLALKAVEALNLPDCWIGAGFIRNAVWDALHGRPWCASYGDVVYFDTGNAGPERDGRAARAAGTLRHLRPRVADRQADPGLRAQTRDLSSPRRSKAVGTALAQAPHHRPRRSTANAAATSAK